MKRIILVLVLGLLVSCQKENIQPNEPQAQTVVQANVFEGTWAMVYVAFDIPANGSYTYDLNNGGNGFYTATVSGGSTVNPITWSSSGDSVLTINASPSIVNWINDSTILMNGSTWVKY